MAQPPPNSDARPGVQKLLPASSSPNRFPAVEQLAGRDTTRKRGRHEPRRLLGQQPATSRRQPASLPRSATPTRTEQNRPAPRHPRPHDHPQARIKTLNRGPREFQPTAATPTRAYQSQQTRQPPPPQQACSCPSRTGASIGRVV